MSRPETSIEIRVATADDAAAVHGLISELARTTGLENKFRGKVEDYLAHGFGANPKFEALVATEADEVVGVALYFFTFSSWRGEPGIYLQDLVVTESSRGLRLGERLMQRLVLVAKEHGATHVRLAVDSDNAAAMRFYERCGMSNVESDCIYEIEGEPFEQLGSSS